jgi:CubicO group peptidase (beta-lactamase class C family)
MKHLLFAIIFFVWFTCFTKEKQKDYSEAIKLIEVWLDAQKDYEKLPGITASIVSNQDLIWSGAFGMANIDGNVEADTKTLCSICSISKLFTSIAIMKLYDEGKLRLDDSVTDILPWYNLEQQFADSGPITIRSLLSHSSGLPRENTFSHWNGPDFSFPTKDQIKATLANQKTLYPASTYYQYSNLALTLLGYVIEEISGDSFEGYVTQNILSPLGLLNTTPTMPRALHGNELAIGYTVLSRQGEREKMNFFEANGVNAAAGFASNVEDLAKFASWQFRLLDTTAAEILKPSTLRNMHNVHWINSDWSGTRGLGFGVYKDSNGEKWVGHGGYCPGYQTIFKMHVDSKFAYTVMINSNGVNPNKYVNGMYGLIKKVKSVKKDESSSNKKELSEYTGYYKMDVLDETYIATWEGKLAMLDLPSNNPASSMTLFKHIEGDIFRRIRSNNELGEALSFKRGPNGKIVSLLVFENYIYTKAENTN